jgi:hypothetical protein
MSTTTKIARRRRTPDGDKALLDAEQRLIELRQKNAARREAGDHSDHPDSSDDLETLICETAPGSLIGVAVKLRQLVDDLGAGAVGDGDEECARQVLARSSARSSRRRRSAWWRLRRRPGPTGHIERRLTLIAIRLWASPLMPGCCAD